MNGLAKEDKTKIGLTGWFDSTAVQRCLEVVWEFDNKANVDTAARAALEKAKHLQEKDAKSAAIAKRKADDEEKEAKKEARMNALVESMDESNVVLKSVADTFKEFLTPDGVANSAAAAAASDSRMTALESNVNELKNGMTAILAFIQKK